MVEAMQTGQIITLGIALIDDWQLTGESDSENSDEILVVDNLLHGNIGSYQVRNNDRDYHVELGSEVKDYVEFGLEWPREM